MKQKRIYMFDINDLEGRELAAYVNDLIDIVYRTPSALIRKIDYVEGGLTRVYISAPFNFVASRILRKFMNTHPKFKI